MPEDSEAREAYEKELKELRQRQEEEMKKKTNPVFARMHALSEEEAQELKEELEKTHEEQRKELAAKYGIKS